MPDFDDFRTDLRVQLARCADDAAAQRRSSAAAARRRGLQRPPVRRAIALAAALAAGVSALAIGVVLTRPDGARNPSSGAALFTPPTGSGSAVYVQPLTSGPSGSNTAPAATAASYSLAAVAARTAPDAPARGSSFILRFDGVAWHETPAPDVGPLSMIAAPAADRAWALAASGALLSWDGRDWRVDPGAGTTGAHLLALTAPSPDDVWAVGDLGGRPFAEHYDGAVWRVASLPETDGPGGTGTLAAVAASSPTDVWAVGSGDEAGLIPLAYHFDGATWSATTLADDEGSVFGTPATPGALQAVAAVGPGDAWATDGRLVFRWDGDQWQRQRQAPDETYRALSAAGPADLWLVSDRGPVHWDGSSWQVVDAAAFGVATGHVANAAAVSVRAENDVWVVGNTGVAGSAALPLLARWNGTHWQIAGDPVQRR